MENIWIGEKETTPRRQSTDPDPQVGRAPGN